MKLLIIDDHKLFIEGLVAILKDISFISEIYTVSESSQIQANVRTIGPDIILIDINLGGDNGLEIGKKIKKSYPLTKIVVLTMHHHPSFKQQAKEYGFDAFLHKDTSTKILLQTLDDLRIGKAWNWDEHEKEDTELRFLKNNYNLTTRELEIIHYLAQGLDNQQISEKLFLSYYTVKTHRKNIYMKLGVSNIIELTTFAKENLL